MNKEDISRQALLNSTITKLCKPHASERPSTLGLYRWHEYSLLYLFRGCWSSDLTQTFRKWDSEFQISPYRSELTHSGYMLQNVKFWLFTGKIQKGFKIHREDKVLLDVCASSSRIQKQLASLREEYKAVPLNKVHQFLHDSYPEVHKYSTRLVHAKLSFIVKSFNLEAQDLVTDIMAEGLRSFYLTYPGLESKEHGIRLLKRSIHNHAINLIHSFTAQKRKRLISTKTGYASQVLSWEDYISKDVSNPDGTSDCVDLVVKEVHKTSDLKMSVETLLSRVGEMEVKAMRLLMGDVDQKFTAFLMDEGYLDEDETNEDLSEDDEYVSLVWEFLGLKGNRRKQFIRQLKQGLA